MRRERKRKKQRKRPKRVNKHSHLGVATYHVNAYLNTTCPTVLSHRWQINGISAGQFNFCQRCLRATTRLTYLGSPSCRSPFCPPCSSRHYLLASDQGMILFIINRYLFMYRLFWYPNNYNIKVQWHGVLFLWNKTKVADLIVEAATNTHNGIQLLNAR